MSKLSQAVDDVTGAATDLRETAAALKQITASLNTGLVPQAEKTATQAETAIATVSKAADRLEIKANALLGNVGALVEKVTTIVTQVRDGAWIELDQVGFGGELRIGGRVRIVPKA